MILIISFFILSLACLIFLVCSSKNEKLSSNKVRLPVLGGFVIFFILLTIFSSIFMKDNITGNGENLFKTGGLLLLISYLSLSSSLILPRLWHDRHSNLLSIIFFSVFAILLIVSLVLFFGFGASGLDNVKEASSSSLLSLKTIKILLI